jgi:cysteine desulfurase
MGLRPGTVPAPLVVGLGAAAELASREHVQRRRAASRLRKRFLRELAPVDFDINGDPARTMPHVINLSFRGVDSEAFVLLARDDVAISNGAACTSATYATSHVLKAMGLDGDRIASAVRISWGPGVEEIPVSRLLEVLLRFKP